jgi:hypothetical protein
VSVRRSLADDLPPLQRARLALRRIGTYIEVDERRDEIDGNEIVGDGIEALADALAELQDLEEKAFSLDEVLAEMGEADVTVELSAELIRELDQVSYGRLPVKHARAAEELRLGLYEAMDRLISRLEQENGDG